MARLEELGRYRLVRRIAALSSATLYEGEVEGGSPALVWVLSRGAPDPARALEPFRRPAARRDLPVVLEAGEAEGFRFVAGRWFGGRPLSELVARGGPRAARAALAIAGALCRALRALEGAGVPVRSIDPGHVLVDGREICLAGAFLGEAEREPGESIGRLLAFALTGSPVADLDGQAAAGWSGRTRRLLSELGRHGGPPEETRRLEGLQARLEEALHGPSSVPVGLARKASSRPALVLSALALAGGAAVAITLLLGSGDLSGAEDPSSRRTAGAAGSGEDSPSGSHGESDADDRPLAASPFGVVRSSPAQAPVPPPAPVDEPLAPTAVAGPIEVERQEALRLVERNQFRSVRERVAFVLSASAGTPDEDRTRALAAEVEARVEARTIELFRELELARAAGDGPRVESLGRLLVEQGDTFARYRASLLLAIQRDEVRGGARR